MTLEDFFTLTEMKDGLTAPSRVEELVSVMQKEKDCVVKNIGDASRQWAAVASTIAATENRDCLDCFVQLDGLWFFDRWLKDAQKYDNDTSDTFMEESIMALLRALEKLEIDSEKSISSGIWITVRNLLGHRSSQVQDRARALFNGWKQGRVEEDTVHCDDKSVGTLGGDGGTLLSAESSGPVCFSGDVSVPNEAGGKEDPGVQSTAAEMLPSRNLEGPQCESTGNLHIPTNKNELTSQTSLEQAQAENTSHDLASFDLLNSVKEDTPMKEKSQAGTIDNTESCDVPSLEEKSNEGHMGAPNSNELSKDEKPSPKLSNSPEKISLIASSSVKVDVVEAVTDGKDGMSTQEIVKEHDLKSNVDVNDSDSYVRNEVLGNVGMPAAKSKTETGDVRVTSQCSSQALKPGQVGEFHSDTLVGSSNDDPISEKPDCLETYVTRGEDTEGAEDDKELSSDESEGFGVGSGFTKSTFSKQTPDGIDRSSEMDLDFGVDDALEVARKVAQEVEREVVHYREPSSSSSGKRSEGEIRQPSSPDSINGEDDLPSEEQPIDMPAGQNLSTEEVPKEKQSINGENLKNQPENGINDMESSQVTEAAQEPEVNAEKSLCGFDLNQEVSSDDVDHPVNSSLASVSVVSASRPTAAPGLSASPLQFEGALGWKGSAATSALGWKGSAATSAFRPASPRNSGKSLSLGGTSDMPNKRLDRFDFDLNVAEGGDEKPADLLPGKQLSISSGLRSTESSLEVRSERPNLDLNRVSDDGDAPPPPDLRNDGGLFFNRNGHRSPSPASSSSSMQPSLRNIDLNDRPFFYNDSADQGLHLGKPSQNMSVLGGIRQDEPVISIMGARVEVNRRDLSTQAPPLSNGKAIEPAMDSHIGRTGGFLGIGPAASYSHSPVFGYNGLTPAPAMPFPMYGPSGSVPYMLERVATVVPPFGSGSAVAPSYSQPPLIMNLAAAPSGLNGAGPSRPSLDLNSGFVVEGGNKDPVGFRQFLMPAQGRSFEEQLRANSQPSSSSGFGLKRKEPDGGWEPYPFNYRPQPPWS